MNKGVKAAVLIIVGILSIVLAFVCYNKEIGQYEYAKYYGGDAYTGIQQASAQAANNVLETNKILKFGFGSVLLVAGIAMLLLGFGSFSSSGEPRVINNYYPQPNEKADEVSKAENV